MASLLLVQTLFGLMASLLIFAVLRRIFGVRVWLATAAAILLAIEPSQLFYERMVMTETSAGLSLLSVPRHGTGLHADPTICAGCLLAYCLAQHWPACASGSCPQPLRWDLPLSWCVRSLATRRGRPAAGGLRICALPFSQRTPVTARTSTGTEAARAVKRPTSMTQERFGSAWLCRC